MSKKVLTSRPAPVGVVEPVRSVTHAEYRAALEPLMALLGTSSASVMADSITEVSPHRISFVTCEPMAGIEPIEWGSWDEKCPTCGIDHDGHAAIWAWPVEVELVLPKATT